MEMMAPSGEVLNGDAQRQDKGTHYSDLASSGQKARIDHPHRHPLWDVVEGDGQHHHGGALQPGAGSLCLLAPLVEVGDQVIQTQQEEDTGPEADDRWQKDPDARPSGLLHGGDQQAPDGCSHHNARGKAGEPPLHPVPQALLQKKRRRRPGRCREAGRAAPKLTASFIPTPSCSLSAGTSFLLLIKSNS